MEEVGVFGGLGKELTVEGFGLVEAAGLVELDGLGESRPGRI